MKKYLTQLIFFILLVFASVYIIFSFADGFTDPFYIRFTTPKQTSLILGTSRAAQGIQPAVINKYLAREDIFNYSFTIGQSPYGPTYLKSIKKKLNHNTKDGIFLLTVDPWSLSCNCYDPEDVNNFRESTRLLANMNHVNSKINISYFLNNYSEPYYKLLYKSQKSMFLHLDGWLEVTVDMDSFNLNNRLARTLDNYRLNNLPSYKFSSKRLDYLINTIDFLSNHGSVYLIRLPVHPLMMEVDEALVPHFENIIMEISHMKNIPFLDLIYLNEDLLYTDGNHLHKDSGLEVSIIIGEWILDQQKNIGSIFYE